MDERPPVRGIVWRVFDPFWLGIASLVVVALFCAGLPQSLRFHYAHRHEEAALRGKTADEVIVLLGTPASDSRHDDVRGAAAGTFTFTYDLKDGYRLVRFESGLVARVQLLSGWEGK